MIREILDTERGFREVKNHEQLNPDPKNYLFYPNNPSSFHYQTPTKN